MRILHVMAGLGEASGVANIARRFARIQRERGDSTVLLAPTWKWNPAFFGFRFAVRTWLQARTADEVWVHCSWTFPVWFGAWLAKRLGKKLVVVPEGSFDPKRLHNHAGWKKRLVAPLDRWVLRQADEVLALCPDEIAWVKAFEPSATVCLARVPMFFAETGTGERDGIAPRNRPLHVLFLGRRDDPLKGVRYLERAVNEINAVNHRRQGQEKMRQFHSSTSTSHVDAISLRVESSLFGEAKEQAWAWCDVLCLPTLSENFGLVVAEALEHGKRVIVTDGAPAWRELTPEQGVYLRGFRDGDDATRIRLLSDALSRLSSAQ